MKSGYYSFQLTNNKGPDQTAQMRRLDCAIVVHKAPEDRFSRFEAYITKVMLNIRHNLNSIGLCNSQNFMLKWAMGDEQK